MAMKKKILLILSLFTLFGCSANNSTSSTSSDIGSTSNSISPSEPAKYIVEEQYVYKNEQKIYGKLYTPVEQKEKYPLVILSHSAFLTGDSLKSYAKEFANRGYMAYTFDFCGGSSSSKSDGNVKSMTIFSEVDDLKAVINTFKNNEKIDLENIYLFGTSQGGLVSAITANDYNEYIKGLMLLYPAFNIPDQVKDSSYSDYMSIVGIGKAYFETLKDYDPYEHIANFKKDVIIIHGDSDTTVSLDYSKKANETYENSTLYVIKGAGHGFNRDNYSFFGNYDNYVWTFIDEYLSKQNKNDAND